MTAQLLTSILWIVIIMLPVNPTIPEKLALLFMPGVSSIIKYILILLVGVSATYALFKYLLIGKIQESFGSSERAPDGLAPVATVSVLVVSVIYAVLKLQHPEYGIWPLSGVLAVDALVVFGLLNGAGKKATLNNTEEPGKLPAIHTDDVESTDQSILQETEWIHNEEPYTSTGRSFGCSIKVSVPQELYNSCVALSESNKAKKNYTAFTTRDDNESVVLSVAGQLREIAGTNNLRGFAELHLVFSFFSCFRYVADQPGESDFEYIKYPAQTFANLDGDSFDIAIACSAVLARMGYRAFLSTVNDHAFVGAVLPGSNDVPRGFQQKTSL